MNNPLSVRETTTATSNLGTTYTVTNYTHYRHIWQ